MYTLTVMPEHLVVVCPATFRETRKDWIAEMNRMPDDDDIVGRDEEDSEGDEGENPADTATPLGPDAQPAPAKRPIRPAEFIQHTMF